MKRARNRIVILALAPAIALVVVATVVAQERRSDRGDSTRGNGNRGDTTRGDGTRPDATRPDGTRMDRGDRGTGGGRFSRRPPTTSPTGANGQGFNGQGSTGPTASAGPTTGPAYAGTTQPSAPAVASGRPLPDQFAVLGKRSIFVRDRSRLASAAREFTPAPASAPAAPPRPEASLALRGLSLQDTSGYTALIEDVSANKTLEFKVGDRIARGVVKELSLDYLAYESGGKVTRISMGQNLDGETVASTYTPPVAAATPGGLATTRPAGSVSPAPGAPGAAPAPLTGGGDLVEQMRRRRQQEQGR
jgi:hypothetical protein